MRYLRRSEAGTGEDVGGPQETPRAVATVGPFDAHLDGIGLEHEAPAQKQRVGVVRHVVLRWPNFVKRKCAGRQRLRYRVDEKRRGGRGRCFGPA